MLSGDKDSSSLIMNKHDYNEKVWKLIQDGVDTGKYELTEDSTHRDLHNFQQFLYRNFQKHEHYEKMRPISNQPARFFATAKTHKFKSFDDITLEELKLRPIIDQTGTHTQQAAKIVSKYLKPLAKNKYVINNTLKFPELLKGSPINEDEQDVSYDVESLFTSIPVSETIDFILSEIYDRKVIKPFCKKRLHFKRLLERLTSECKFSVDDVLIRQKDGCPMGGSLSVDFADIFMNKLERDVVIPRDPTLYLRYVDDTFNRRKKNVPDDLFNSLNNYHPNIKYTVEENPKHFLDTAIIYKDGEIQTNVHVKDNKFPVFWASKVPKRYKRNAINGELHRASKISSNFNEEIRKIHQKFKNVGYPAKFIDSVIRDFQKVPNQENDDIIPSWLFDERKDFSVKLPFCLKNEELSKTFLRKLDEFTNEKYRFKIIWNTRNIRSLFPLKDRVEHVSCVVYEGTCSCDEVYVGETDRLVSIRWKEHDNPSTKHSQNSDPAKHLLANPTHRFSWKILTSAPRNYHRRKILENYYIAHRNPKINVQKTPRVLFLFRNGIT